MTGVLDNRVLVLSNWQPIAVTTAFKALAKVFAGRARIVDRDYAQYDWEEWVLTWEDAVEQAHKDERAVIRGTDFSVPVPEVILLSSAVKSKFIHNRRAKLCRKAVFQRDGNVCQYCGKSFSSRDMNIDHVFPKSRGGKTTWTNVVLSCIACNHRKANRTPEEANMRLLRKPFEPHWTQVGRGFAGSVPKSWEEFLGRMYWSAELDKT
jgi:5-methylcytosine-specific restriction endonuclease McrA